MTLFLLFAWAFLALAFHLPDANYSGYVLISLLLLWFGIETCRDLYHQGIEASQAAILGQYDQALLKIQRADKLAQGRKVLGLMKLPYLRAALSVGRSRTLFMERGKSHSPRTELLVDGEWL